MEEHGVKQRLVNELHKPARRNFERRKMVMKGVDDLWQIDLVEMNKYSRANSGFNYILTVICVFSKYAWAVPVRRKNAKDVTNAMESIFKLGRTPKNVQSDMGKEFWNSSFAALMKKYSINHYSTYSTMKAFICERFNRTLKNMMWKEFSMQGNYKWLSLLPKLVNRYRNTVHRTIKMKPVDVDKENEKELLTSVYKIEPQYRLNPKFKVGDKVRISKAKSVFAKGYTQNWSSEIFKIIKVQNTNPVTYILEDYLGKPVLGGFYEQELQKSNVNDVYLIEKIVKQTGDRIFVKFFGFDSTHNAWINKKDIVK